MKTKKTKRPFIPVTVNQDVVEQIKNIFRTGFLNEDKEYVKDKMTDLMLMYGRNYLQAHMPDADDAFQRWYFDNYLGDAKCDDPELSNRLLRAKHWDTELDGYIAFFRQAESTAERAQAKLDELEAKSNVNRSSVDNKSYWHKRAGETVLSMEHMHDQYILGLLQRETVRKHMENVYKSCQKRLNKVRWIKKSGKFGVVGYIPQCGYSVTDLRSLANGALDILEQMGYRIPGNWWYRNSNKEIVVYQSTWENARQERDSTQIWDSELKASGMFDFYDEPELFSHQG